MQQSAFHNTRKWPGTSKLVTPTCTPWCFWVLSVTGSIRECDWLKTVLPQRAMPSAFCNITYWLGLCKSPQLFCHCKFKFRIHIPVVNNIQGRAEPNTNVCLSFLKCSPIIDAKDFKVLQFSNFRLISSPFPTEEASDSTGSRHQLLELPRLIGSLFHQLQSEVPSVFLLFLPSMVLQVFWSFCTVYQLQREVGSGVILSLFYSLVVVVGYCKIIELCVPNFKLKRCPILWEATWLNLLNSIN